MVLKVRGLKVIIYDPLDEMSQRAESAVMVAFGRHLRELRTKKGLSQEALASSCGLDRTYVGGVERGERNISLVNIHKIADALHVPVRELF